MCKISSNPGVRVSNTGETQSTDKTSTKESRDDELTVSSGQVKNSPGNVSQAMNSGGQTRIKLPDSVSSSDESSGEDEISNKNVGGTYRQDVGEITDEVMVHLDDDKSLPPSNRPTPPEDRGPGGCCSCWTRTVHTLKAGLIQAVSTALTFGTKPLVEAAVLSAFGVTSITAAPLVATLTASVVGGIYVGVVHTTVSRIVSGLMNSALSMNTYSPNPDSHALLGEMGTIDAPVMGAFIGGSGLRGMLMDGQSSVWLHALSKTVTSTSAGFLQGMITDALRQTMAAFEKVYSEKPSANLDGKQLQFVKDTFEKTLNVNVMSGKELGHDLFGKTVGSTFGMLYPQFLKSLDLSSAVSGAVGMTLYLTSWFTGIHVSSAIMDTAIGDPPQTGVRQQPPTETTPLVQPKSSDTAIVVLDEDHSV